MKSQQRILDYNDDDCRAIWCQSTMAPEDILLLHAGRSFASESHSGYNVDRMRHEIVVAPEAVEDFRRLPATVRSKLRGAIETHLRHEPTKTSRSRIKRLRGMSRPQYRLRVDDVRVFYDVSDSVVEILAIVLKSRATEWLEQRGDEE